MKASPQMLDESVGFPHPGPEIIVAATRSKRQLIQAQGRGLRPKPGGNPRLVVPI